MKRKHNIKHICTKCKVQMKRIKHSKKYGLYFDEYRCPKCKMLEIHCKKKDAVIIVDSK